jgi:replicative DNA helicase
MSRKPRIDTNSIDSVPLKPGNTSVPASERIVLTGLLQHGDKVLFEILAYVSVDSFVTIENQAIFKSINDLIINDKIEKPGLASIIAYLNKHSFEFKIDLEEYLQTLEIQKVSLQEIYHHAKRVGRAKILREAKMALLHAGDAVENADIDRPIAETLNKIEEPILLLHSNLTGQNDSVEIGKLQDLLLQNLPNRNKVMPESRQDCQFMIARSAGDFVRVSTLLQPVPRWVSQW